MNISFEDLISECDRLGIHGLLFQHIHLCPTLRCGGYHVSFWWVNHKQTHTEEIEGGYIWSPKSNKNGARNETYLNLTRTRVADIVFSYASGAIRAVGVVEADHRECDRPMAFGKTGEQWDPHGWIVPIDWSVLRFPIVPKFHLDAIRPLLPAKNAPIRPNGKGNQGCYLAEISDALGGLLASFIFASLAPRLNGRN